jgi:hypothetical protein
MSGQPDEPEAEETPPPAPPPDPYSHIPGQLTTGQAVGNREDAG